MYVITITHPIGKVVINSVVVGRMIYIHTHTHTHTHIITKLLGVGIAKAFVYRKGNGDPHKTVSISFRKKRVMKQLIRTRKRNFFCLVKKQNKTVMTGYTMVWEYGIAWNSMG